MVSEAGALNPIEAFAIVGIAGVGAQWLAWRFRMPGIVLMLVAGLILGPVTGIFVPERDIGELLHPMISLAVAVILFEGGLTLDFHRLGDARPVVKRLVLLGAPLGWVLSALALNWVAGLSWETSIVFGGIMIVTGPTVIAPLLRQARLQTRPAQALHWEAIVNDALGALAAVFAVLVVLVRHAHMDGSVAAWVLVKGVVFASLLGLAGGHGIVAAFRHNLVPEYMKVPVLFVTVIMVFAGADMVLPESGLLSVTVMGIVIANAKLPSYAEIYRFKESATILLVSGVFILLAAGVEFHTLQMLDWRALAFVLVVMLVVRPLTVMLSLAGTGLPWQEKLLIALTGPRGVVLVAVSGVFAARLVSDGIEDGVMMVPLAFVLVLATVVLNGFTLAPIARALQLTAGERPGLVILGGSVFATGLAQALEKAGVNVLIADPNRAHLLTARAVGVPYFHGDILSEAAEDSIEFIAYTTLLAASDNDAYNTLVATDLAPELGRDAIWQLARHKEEIARHALPKQLGGQHINGNRTLEQYLDLIAEGWIFRTTRLTEEYTLQDWREARPEVIPLVVINRGRLQFIRDPARIDGRPGTRIVSMIPPETVEKIRHEAELSHRAREIARVEARILRDADAEAEAEEKGRRPGH
ncbi:cation:proton antiporter [Paracoccus lutimaris]|uniref:Sodium/proton antiporter (CPA1 family) n=1 Tax=Paracoccus lutimaris TaxID=1490030 RepID=A0A368YV90_9RHOB|nr:sodium:proton antiporter [Paracoccus lutimaris]RCW84130.1 sodium/proton antiporter (CPA1 family) [Paracoccus lutimaris]